MAIIDPPACFVKFVKFVKPVVELMSNNGISLR
jgi:hypothetical protein